MKTKKKKLYLLLAVGLSILFTVAAINAFGASKSSDIANNRLRVPTLEGKITEKFEEKSEIKIGETREKDIKITHTEKKGNAPLFVRVMVMPLLTSDEGVLLPMAIGEELTVDLGADWKDGGDGYYYYLNKLEPEQATSSLFTKVTVNNALGDDYLGAKLSIQVKSETVTTLHYEYRNAWWAGKAQTEAPLKAIDEVFESLRIGR